MRQSTQEGTPARGTNDCFLGFVKVRPNFESNKVEDQFLEITGGTGVIHVQLCYKPAQVSKETMEEMRDRLLTSWLITPFSSS